MTVRDLIARLQDLPQGANVITELELDFYSVKVEQITDRLVAINPAPLCELLGQHLGQS